MRLQHLVLGVAVAGLVGSSALVSQAQAQDSIYVPLLTYRTGPFTLNGSGRLTGTWQPDARNIDPSVSLDVSPRSAFLSNFNNTSVGGEWTLFLADVSNGGGQSTLNSWSLDATPVVPEPSTTLLFVLGGVGLLLVMRRNAARKSNRGADERS